MFNNDLVYVGQSINIKDRVSHHFTALRCNKHYNYKLQEAYQMYGLPEVYTLEYSKSDSLDSLEFQWIREFDSCINGLNIRDEEEHVLRGPNSNSAKYTEEQVLKVFKMLQDPSNSYKSISEASDVPIGNINQISKGSSHVWLKEKYPTEYEAMISLKGTRNGKQNSRQGLYGIGYPDIVSPTGEVFKNVGNLSAFCKQHNVPVQYMRRLLSGERKSPVGGWFFA